MHLLTDAGFILWQMQFAVDHPEGLHACFVATGRPMIEVVTHSQAVRDAILAFKGE